MLEYIKSAIYWESPCIFTDTDAVNETWNDFWIAQYIVGGKRWPPVTLDSRRLFNGGRKESEAQEIAASHRRTQEEENSDLSCKSRRFNLRDDHRYVAAWLSSSGDGTLCFSTVCVDGRSWSEGAVRSELRDNPLATVWTVKDADWPGSTLPLSTPSQTLRLYILPRLAPCSIYSHYFPMPIFLIKLHCYVCQWSLSKLTLSHTTK